jgi:tricarballylate dehydrogenase
MTDEAIHYDELIVGAGNAACAAALAALEQKVSVGLLEKAPQRDRGGNSALTGHMRFVFHGIDDLRPLVKTASEAELQSLIDRLPRRTEEDAWDEVMRVTNNQSDPELLQLHVTESRNTMQWLASKGQDWVPAIGMQALGDNILIMNGGGYGLQQRYYAVLERGGARIHYETAAMELIKDVSGRVTGVHAWTPQGYRKFTAGAVVLACGSFESNPEMRARYLGVGWDTVRIRGVPFNTGEGLAMAMAIGAMPHGSWTTCHASPQDLNIPESTTPSAHAASGGDSMDRYVYPYSIMVNVNGERFVDEGEDTRGRTYAKMGRAILAQPGGVAFQILDAKARKMNLYPTNYAQATGAKADTLEKLAAELDINAENFVRTVRAFNSAIQPGTFNPDRHRVDGKGTAGLTPRKSNYALSIEEPPFEGWAVRCGMTFTFGGLKIVPATAQVQHVAGRPIPGLYTAGEMVGGLWIGNYASGSGMMAGATFGRIAGIHAARSAREG